MPDHSTPCTEVQLVKQRQEEVIDVLRRMEGKLDTALEEGADRETRLQLIEQRCRSHDKFTDDIKGRLWGFLFAILAAMALGFGGLVWKLGPLLVMGR